LIRLLGYQLMAEIRFYEVGRAMWESKGIAAEVLNDSCKPR